MAAGERVELAAAAEPSAAAAPRPRSFEVVYEDDDLLVVDKPAGLVTHPGARATAARRSPRRSPAGPPADVDPERAGIVHRLDRDTSGLLVVARTEEAHAALQRMLRAREITREYLALVSGPSRRRERHDRRPDRPRPRPPDA